MTRINTIDPALLTNEWLIAEWRELPRISNELEKHPLRFKPEAIPLTYRLGSGHVTFFRDKLLYLAKRHREIKRELRKRKIRHNRRINVQLWRLTEEVRSLACNDWQPCQDDHLLNIMRLCDRFDARKKAYHYHDQKLNDDQTFNDYLKIIEKDLAL